jgi:hypothetical protein
LGLPGFPAGYLLIGSFPMTQIRNLLGVRLISSKPPSSNFSRRFPGRNSAFYRVLALMILNLLRRKLAQSGIVLGIVEMMNQLTEINEVTLLFPAPQRSKEPVVQTQLSKLNDRQKNWLPSIKE